MNTHLLVLTLISLFLYPISLPVGGVANSGLSNVKKAVPGSADVDVKQDGGVVGRKAPSNSPPSPLLGNANNPNKADIPERKTGSSVTPNVSFCVCFIVLYFKFNSIAFALMQF